MVSNDAIDRILVLFFYYILMQNTDIKNKIISLHLIHLGRKHLLGMNELPLAIQKTYNVFGFHPLPFGRGFPAEKVKSFIHNRISMKSKNVNNNGKELELWIKHLITIFNTKIKNHEIPSKRFHDTGIGKTLEELLGIIENNLSIPDFHGIEIKSHRSLSQSKITLFTKKPDFPKNANKRLLEEFGASKNNEQKIFHATFSALRQSKIYKKYFAELKIDRTKKEIKIKLRNKENNQNFTFGYYFSTINEILQKKLKILAFVEASSKKTDEKEIFVYKNMEIYAFPKFEKFIELIGQGKIVYDVRIGTYKSGKRKGRVHDHGSGFRIYKKELKQLYKIYQRSTPLLDDFY